MTNKIPTWQTIQVKIADLVEWDKNPVIVSKKEAAEIEKSIRKFGLALPMVANAPLKEGRRRLLDGHQRKQIVIASKILGANSTVGVSVPDRLLTDAECDELTLRLRKNQGKFDPVKLNEFDRNFLLDIGFEESELDENDYKNERLKEVEEEVRARPMLRVLISIPIDLALDAKKIINKLEEFKGIEVLYGAND
jgi:hypothetical protein